MARNTISLLSVFLFTLNLSLNSVRAQNAANEGKLSDASSLIFRQMPDSCYNEGLSYCFDKGDAYPQDTVDELLKDMKTLKIDVPEQSSSFMEHRSGDSYDEPDCRLNSTNKPIYYIVDKDDNVRVVVQSPEKFQQIYTVKWCLDEGRIIRDTPHFLKSTTLEQFNIECISTRMNFDFFVLSEDETRIQIVNAKGGIPVCCRCRYTANKEG